MRIRTVPFFSPVAPGETYRVIGYHTGEFIGRCTGVDRTIARFVIIDPLRPVPRIAERCSFPGCVKRDFHEGDHELSRIRRDGAIEVFWENARFVRIMEKAA